MTSYEETEEGKANRLLNAWELIKQEVLSVPALTNAEEQALATQALNGDEAAREQLATYCVRFAIWKAAKYTQFTYSYDEVQDLIGAANENLATALNKALTKENSVAYIRQAIKYGMIAESKFYRKFVTVRLDEVADKFAVELRLPSPVQEETAIGAELREALTTLTQKQRYVVERVYGLDGDSPDSVQALNTRLSPDGRSHSLAYGHLVKALRRLRETLDGE